MPQFYARQAAWMLAATLEAINCVRYETKSQAEVRITSEVLPISKHTHQSIRRPEREPLVPMLDLTQYPADILRRVCDEEVYPVNIFAGFKFQQLRLPQFHPCFYGENGLIEEASYGCVSIPIRDRGERSFGRKRHKMILAAADLGLQYPPQKRFCAKRTTAGFLRLPTPPERTLPPGEAHSSVSALLQISAPECR